MAYWSGPGEGDVGAYQVSGIPYLASLTTGQTKTLRFNYLTSEVIVSVGSGATCTLDFQDSTSGGPVTTTLGPGSYNFRVRTTALKAVATGGTVGICASLTGIKNKYSSSHDQDDYGTTS